MLFKKNKKNGKWFSKMDKIVTGLIVGWAAASIFGIAYQTKKWKETSQKVKSKTKWFLSNFWVLLAKIVSLFSRKK